MKYSIITINYNNRDGLERTIKSVVNQTCQDFEYIIIDGGSTDGSVDVIKKYADRIDYWVSEPDNGIYNAMNKGVIKAHGEYLNFMNSGDCFYNEKVLDEIYNLCVKDIIIGRVCSLNTNSNPVSHYMELKDISMFYFYLSSPPHQGCFVKRTLFKNKMFDESLMIVSDWKFLMECMVDNVCSYTQISSLVAACEPKGVSGDYLKLHLEKERILRKYLRPGIYRDYEKMSILGAEMYNNILYLTEHDTLRRFVYYIIKLSVLLHKLFK